MSPLSAYRTALQKETNVYQKLYNMNEKTTSISMCDNDNYLI